MSATGATIESITNGGAEFIRAGLPLPCSLNAAFGKALRNVLDDPGSLIRPRIVSPGAVAFGLNDDRATDLAIALEYFHRASLLFDDLHRMDNARHGRGAPCVDVLYGEERAIPTALALAR